MNAFWTSLRSNLLGDTVVDPTQDEMHMCGISANEIEATDEPECAWMSDVSDVLSLSDEGESSGEDETQLVDDDILISNAEQTDVRGTFWNMLRQSNLQTEFPAPTLKSTNQKHGGARRVSRTEMYLSSLDPFQIEKAAAETGLDPLLIRRCRDERFSFKSLKEEMHWLWGKLQGSVEMMNGERCIRYKLADGTVVTRSQFVVCYSLGLSRFTDLEQRALDPLIHQPKPPKVPSTGQGLRFSNTELYMAAYLESFVMLYADEQPNSDVRHLDPVKFGEIWTAYQISCQLRGKMQFLGSKSLLNKVWLNRFLYTSRLSIRRNKGVRGGLCVDCAEIKLMGDRARTQEEIDEFIAASQGENIMPNARKGTTCIIMSLSTPLPRFLTRSSQSIELFMAKSEICSIKGCSNAKWMRKSMMSYFVIFGTSQRTSFQ